MSAETSTRARPDAAEIWGLVAPRRGLLAFGLAMLAVNRVAALVLPASARFLIDDIIGKRNTRMLRPLIGAVLLATVIQGVSAFALTQSLSKAAFKVMAALRIRVRTHVSRLPIAYYDCAKTGALVSRIMNDVEGVRNLLGTGLIDFLGGLLTAAIALVVLIRISPLMTALTVPCVAAAALAFWKGLEAIGPMFEERSRITAEITGRLTESLAGIRVVKGYRAEAGEQAVFARGMRRLLDNVLRLLTVTSAMSLSSTLLLGTVGALVMVLGSRQILAGAMTVGGLFTYTLFLGVMVLPLVQVAGLGSQLSEAIAGLRRTCELLREPPEDADPKRVVCLPPIGATVVFDKVCFAYEPNQPVLTDISFQARPGTITALVGPSGAGKSTIINLLAAFYSPTAGTISVDGVDLCTVRLDSYRSQLGVVFQDPFLFDGTIAENVALSQPGARYDEILRACRIAHVAQFAEALDNKYDTVVGERGVRLSWGQRQRIAIARAVLAHPRILLLDEATSSIDSESEALIQEDLEALMRGCTTFVIAHRLSTIGRADQILVIEAGRIVERGNHESLYACQGRYFELYNRQYNRQPTCLAAGGAPCEAPPSSYNPTRPDTPR